MKSVSFNQKTFIKLGLGFAAAFILIAAASLLGHFSEDKILKNAGIIEFNISEVNHLDAVMAHPYSKILDKIANITLILAHTVLVLFVFVLPGAYTVPRALKNFQTQKEELKFLVYDFIVYLQSVMVTTGLYKLLKVAVGRARPYLYFPESVLTGIETKDFFRSWPSGHSTLAFIAAGFFISWILTRNTEKKTKIFGTSLILLFASATAVLRVFSGNHFFTDVISGAVIGTFCPALVYFIHQKAVEHIKPEGF